MSEEKERERHLFLMLGVRIGANNKKTTVVVPVTEEEIERGSYEAEESWWSGKSANKLAALGNVGSVYSIEGERAEDGHWSLWIGSARWKCQWADVTKRLEWSAADRSCRAELARMSAAKKMAEPLHEQLEPVRRMYRGAVGVRRVALLAEMIRYVTG